MTLRLFPIRATMPPSHVAHTALVIVKEAVHARLLFSCASRCSDTKLAPCLISMGYRKRRMRNGTEEDDTKAENAAPSAEGIPFGGEAESCAPSDNDAAHPAQAGVGSGEARAGLPPQGQRPGAGQARLAIHGPQPSAAVHGLRPDLFDGAGYPTTPNLSRKAASR